MSNSKIKFVLSLSICIFYVSFLGAEELTLRSAGLEYDYQQVPPVPINRLVVRSVSIEYDYKQVPPTPVNRLVVRSVSIEYDYKQVPPTPVNRLVVRSISIEYDYGKFLNQPPEAPILASPLDGVLVNATPTLTWNVPSDPDGNNLHFKVEISTVVDFTGKVTIFESKISTFGFSPTPPVSQGMGTCGYVFQPNDALTDGIYYWRVNAWDGTVYGKYSSTWSFIVDATAPIVELISPSPESIGLSQVFRDTITVIGSANDLHFKNYKLEYATGISANLGFTLLTESTNTIAEGVIAIWDTTNYPPGDYTLRVTAEDIVGNTKSVSTTIYLGEPKLFFTFGQKITNHPQGIALDKQGNIYVSDTNNDLVHKFDSQGNLLQTFGETKKPLFNKPQGIVLDKEGNIFVADTNNHRIVKFFLQTGDILLEIGKKNRAGQSIAGTLPGEFNHPVDVVLDKDENIYVADRANARIQKFSSQGVFLSEVKVALSTFTISEPVGVDVDQEGNIYVTDQANDCLIKYNSTETVLMKIGSSGSQPGNFNKPQDVYVNFLGYIYLTDTNNNRIQKFDRYGNLCAYFGNLGKEENQFNKPTGLSFDSAGNLYVTDSNNSRIQVFGLPVSSPTVVVSAPSLTHSSLPTDFVLGEYYSFPNPAKNGKNPTIHFECGIADKVEIRIYDISGELAHSVTVNGEPLTVNGRYAYEYTWNISDVASGVYIYCIEAKKSGYPEIKVKKKLAVIK